MFEVMFISILESRDIALIYYECITYYHLAWRTRFVEGVMYHSIYLLYRYCRERYSLDNKKELVIVSSMLRVILETSYYSPLTTTASDLSNYVVVIIW